MVTREEMQQTVAKINEEAAAKEATLQSQMSQLKEELNQMRLLLSSRPESSVPITHSAAVMQQSTRGSCIVGQSEQPPPQVPSPPRQAASPPRQAESPPRQAASPPPQVPSPPPQVPSPPAHLTAKEKIEFLANNNYFVDKSWPVQEVVGVPHQVDVYLDNIDVLSLLIPGQELSNPIIQLFMKFMHQELVQRGRINDFGFLCPVYASTTAVELRQEYMSKRVCEVIRKVYLFPFFRSRHWQLVLMCMDDHKVIFLCSINSEPDSILKQTVDNAMVNFQVEVKKKPVSEVVNPRWLRPETHRQPTGSNLCGLYVMIHMYDVIRKGTTKLFSKTFAGSAPFPDYEVEHIRNLFCEYLYELIHS